MIHPASSMPLIAMSKVHKTFPERFAARFTEHVQRQRPTYKVIADNSNIQGHVRRDQLKKKQSEEMVFSSNEENNIIKRPRTPVVGLDDSEEENSTSNDSAIMDTNSNNQSGHRGCGQSCHSTVEHSAPNNVKDNGVTLSQAWWAVRPKSRGSCARSTSRTTVSLDSVDLWDLSDSEECEVNISTVSKEGYDKVNGVFVNPRKTFDFSELRRSRSPVVKEENVVRVRNARNHKETKPILAKPQERTPPPVTQKSEKCDRKQTVADRLKYLQQRQKELEAGTVNTAETSEHAKEKVNKLQSTPQTDIEMLPQEEKQVKSILSPPKEAFVERTKPSKTDINANCTSGFGSRGKPRVRLVPGLHTQPASDLQTFPSARRTIGTCVSSDVFPPDSVTNMAVEEAASITYPLTKHQRSRRKVKFNTVVSVREGELNKQDTLKTSSKNSAQAFKQKYLLGIPNREETVVEESPRPHTPTPPELPCSVQPAY